MHNIFKNLDLNDFDYDLPNEKIANYPASNRDECKLLVFDKDNQIFHTKFNEITNFIPNDTLLILNSTKVLPARILVNKPTGALVELLLLEPNNNIDYQIAISATNSTQWQCIIGGRNIKLGDKFYIINKGISITIEILERWENKANIKFSWIPENLSFGEVLENIGKTPLPYYIKRDVVDKDKDDYQTIYANEQGSVAAPTAGLHFTKEVLSNIKGNSIKISELILHVGAGTFIPISTSIDSHKMHAERIQVSKKTIINLLTQYVENKPVVATGTTSLRTLESLYWFGIELIKSEIDYEKYEKEYGFYITQNKPYKNKLRVSLSKSFDNILDFMEINNLNYIQGSTEIFIVPGYNIRTINGLITNFHQPKSTLMLLVSAFIGTDNVKKVYQEALLSDYTFLSYGDASLLLK